MADKTFVDGILVDWGASLFNQSPVKRARPAPKNALTGQPATRKRKASGSAKSTVSKADAVRTKLQAVAKRTPEVMVKISGGGKGMIQVRNHLDYISRNGQIDMEDENGNMISGRDEVDILHDEWKYGGIQLADESPLKEAFNIVLSMPEGTDALGVKKAARDFAAREFDGYQYAMALHTYDTDPDPTPARHPHVHLTVKARGFDGTRLNPRKDDLQRWREGFAEALRDHGIEAAATSRQARMNRVRGEKMSVKEIRKRGERLKSVGKSQAGLVRVAKAKATENKVVQSYREIAHVLSRSDSLDDRKLAIDLANRLKDDIRLEVVPRARDKPDGREPER